MFEFITRGSFERHLGELRAALKTAATRCWPRSSGTCRARVSRPEGGYFVWLELPGQPDGGAVLERAPRA